MINKSSIYRGCVPATFAGAIFLAATLGADTPATAPASHPLFTVRFTAEKIMSQMRHCSFAILNSDIPNMPTDIGSIFSRMEFSHKELDAMFPNRGDLNNEQKKALLFLLPSDKREISEYPDRKWINENAAWVYEANNKVVIKNLKNYADTVVLHEKLDGENANKQFFVLCFVDGHCEITKRDFAEKVIAESKKVFKDAENPPAP